MTGQENFYATFDQILPNLFLGNSDSAYDPSVLKILDVSHILVMGEQLEIRFPNTYTYKKIPLEDSANTNLLQYVDQCNNFIEAGINGRGVLVHCRFGISRSSAIVIAYIMKTKSQPFMKSYNDVKHKREIVKPNKGFVRQLLLYEQNLKLNK